MDTTKIRTALAEKLKELEARAADIQDDLSAPPDQDWDENAIDSEDDEVLGAVGNLTLHDMREIKLAISRIDSGNYGSCTACNAKIPAARLKALPSATTCVGCSSS